MQFGFITESAERGKAALILYACYRSRNQQSSLNGLETWNRFTSYIRGAALKATNVAEFVNHFCKLGNISSVKPAYLKDESGLVMQPDGSVIVSADVKDFKIDIFEDDDLLSIFENEGMLLTMLVRERIQREKMEGIEDEIED